MQSGNCVEWLARNDDVREETEQWFSAMVSLKIPALLTVGS